MAAASIAGEGNEHHGWRCCRYLGWTRYALQAYLTTMALNLERMVRLLTGYSFQELLSAGRLN